MPRPEAKIDWEIVDRLTKAGCLGTEVAAFFGIHPNTFYKRVQEEYNLSFSEFLQEKKHRGDALLRMQQYEKAIGESKKGDNMMLIWLGKNRLGQRDHEEKNDSPKQEDLNLKNQLYSALYENQKLKEQLNVSQPQASSELQRSNS